MFSPPILYMKRAFLELFSILIGLIWAVAVIIGRIFVFVGAVSLLWRFFDGDD